jgi:two-component system invasion response regulator UvrY
MAQHYKVLMADDHILLRNALATLIDTFDECTVIHLAGNGEEVKLAMQSGEKPDIAILDLNMPKMDGYETAMWLQENHPTIKILILTMYDSEIALIRLLQAGVRGFLKKDIHPDELKAAILAVANNGYYYSHNTTGKLTTFFQKTMQASIEKTLLSELEIQFLKLASTDMTYKEIATAMQLTPRTVDNHRDALFEKLDVKSRVGLAIYAVKNGIITF